MNLRRWLCFGALAVAVVTVAGGQAPPRTPIQVNVGGTFAAPTLQVTPERARICVNAANCPQQARWRSVGKRLAPNEQLELRSKEGDCFSTGTFVLTRETTEVDSGTPTGCAAGSEWGYDVVLLRGGREVARLDPALVIDP